MLNKYIVSISFFIYAVSAFATQPFLEEERPEAASKVYAVPSLKELALLNVLNECPSEDFEPYAKKISGCLPADLVNEARYLLEPFNYPVLEYYYSIKLLKGKIFELFKNEIERSNEYFYKEIEGQTMDKISAFFWCSNPIMIFPSVILQTKNLQFLELNCHRLTILPYNIGQLMNLKELSLCNNRLTTLPAEIGQLTNLVHLWLCNNHLTTLPAKMGQLLRLWRVSLKNNRLDQFPEVLCEVTSLEYLKLSNNQLTALSPKIGQLINLEILKIHNNQLTTLLPTIWQLKKLQVLKVDNNRLTTLPAELAQLSELNRLLFKGNPLGVLPEEVTQLITSINRSELVGAIPLPD